MEGSQIHIKLLIKDYDLKTLFAVMHEEKEMEKHLVSFEMVDNDDVWQMWTYKVNIVSTSPEFIETIVAIQKKEKDNDQI